MPLAAWTMIARGLICKGAKTATTPAPFDRAVISPSAL